MRRKPPEFTSRWLIQGQLKTLAPLHLGHGGWFACMVRQDEREPEVQVRAVCKDVQGKPFIPGSAIKGALRQRLERDPAALRGDPIAELLGTRVVENPKDTNDQPTLITCGGQAEFWDAQFLNGPAPFPAGAEPPCWCADALTGIAAGVAIERRTRTAEENKLFFAEFVPAGVTFQVTIAGQNLTDAQVGSLLAALSVFNDPAEGIRLGSGVAHGWGKCEWVESTVRVFRMGSGQVAAWLNNPANPANAGWAALPEQLTGTQVEQLRSQALPRVRPPRLVLDLKLQFTSPLLVNDPSKARARQAEGNNEPGEDEFHMVAQQTPDGRVLLPGSSVHGVFRSRAEMILRTIIGAGGRSVDEAVPPPDVARQVKKTGEVDRLPTMDRLFGVSGWRSSIRFSEFVGGFRDPSDPAVPQEQLRCTNHDQEFVAIDRFTGGVSGGGKFRARAALNPELHGTLVLELGRLESCCALPAAAGLLALVFRDSIEGDLTFGMGASKGFGQCRVVITGARLTPGAPLPGTCPPPARAALEAGNVPTLDDGLRDWLRELVATLRERPDLRSLATPTQSNP